LSEIGFIKNGLPFFAPHQEFKFILTDMAENYDKKIENSFDIKITYISSIRESYSSKYRIDLSQQSGLTQIGEPPIYEIAKSMGKIQKSLDNISTRSNKLEVIAYTKNEIEEEEKRSRPWR